jgi:transposase-like protein
MLNSETIWKKVMTKKTRRRYTAEFKAAAVARLDEPGETLSSVAQALGVAATQVKTWRLEQQAAGSAEAVARRRAEASRTAAAAARQQAAPGRERDPAESLGFFRQVGGESMKAKLDLHPVWRTPLLAHAAKAVTSNWTGLR